MDIGIDYYDNLKRFALNLTNNEADAEDLVQEAYMKVIIKYKESYAENIRGILTTTVRNLFINGYRHNKKYKKGELNLKYFGKEENRGKVILLARDIAKYAMNLSIRDRKIITMWMKGYKYNEISKEMDVSLGTVKNSIYSIRQKLKFLKL